MKEGFMEVNKSLFLMMVKWANENIKDFHSQSVMVADRINYMDGNKELVAYASLAYGERFYIKTEAFSI